MNGAARNGAARRAGRIGPASAGRRAGCAAALLAALLAPGTALRAQDNGQGDEERVVQLTVVSSGDNSVYLDHGRDVGLQVGTRVRLFPPEGGEVEVAVRSLSQSSARAELPPGVPVPPVGTRGEATVTQLRAEPSATAPQAPGRSVPDHPPWTRSEAPRGDDQPLLVPTFGQRPDERPTALDGRWFAFGQWNQDRGDSRDSQYLLFRTGLYANATNWLGTGERIRVAGEFDERRVMLADAPDQTDTTSRLDLASVAFGTEAYAPVGGEFGRFLSPHLPEIGLVDGAEVVLRFQDGVRVGGGFGAYPRPFPQRDAGDDVGVHAFVDYVSDPKRTVAGAIGVQKTWHLGAPDRDLLLLRSEFRPFERVTLLGSAKVDYYTGGDTIKGRGLELTELLAQARWDGRDVGLGVTASSFRWPELKRAEYVILTQDLVQNGLVERISVQGSWRPTGWLSLRARSDQWRDQVRDGNTFGGDADVRGILGKQSVLSLSAFRSEGSYTSGPGLRMALRDRIGDVAWRVGYRWYRYDLDTLVTGAESYTRQSAELALSLPIGRGGDLDLTAEHWFGDGQDALTIGCYVQWRF